MLESEYTFLTPRRTRRNEMKLLLAIKTYVLRFMNRYVQLNCHLIRFTEKDHHHHDEFFPLALVLSLMTCYTQTQHNFIFLLLFACELFNPRNIKKKNKKQKEREIVSQAMKSVERFIEVIIIPSLF
jgi:hypothetical protein